MSRSVRFSVPAQGVAEPRSVPSHAQDESGRVHSGMFSEPAYKKWGRRAVSIPILLLLTMTYGACLPLLTIYSVVRDLGRGRRALPLLRFHVYIFSVLFIQALGLILLLGSWFYGLFLSRKGRAELNLNIEIFYIPKTIALAEIIYGMEIEIEDIACATPGPILLLSRHASVLDTIMPIKLLGQAHGMGMRIVQKSELLWNPIVDIASHRMPRAFIKRGTGNAERQVAHMQHLLSGITDRQALVVFPEGSRFSQAKKDKIVAKLYQNNPEAADQASQLQHILPARPAGTCALLEARPDIDVVFLAHTGLEDANRLEDFIAGALYKKKIRMKFWRVPASEIPEDQEGRTDWLHQEWSKVDRWIAEN
ncbi:MAG: hypothetical protein GY811_30245 [Myxococcales bacterium]|nr:hypothetical protein [Myxococcales bacterium]